MSTSSLLNAADAIGGMIKAARVDIARGREVNLGGIEQMMASIYRRVMEDAEAEPRVDRFHLVRKLTKLVGELDALEGDLTSRRDIIMGD